jgi:hypothetical protein
MEDEIQTQEAPSFGFGDYLPSAGIVGVIFSLISFATGLFFGYQQINSEPTGSFVSPFMISSGVICLVSALAGLLAVWHFTKEVSPKLKLGQGAVLGFLTGAIIAVLSVVFSELWILLFDPEYTEKILSSLIANIEEMELPSAQKDGMIDAYAEGFQQSSLRQLFMGIPITGLINLITALIGVKIFAEKPEEKF